MTLEIISWSISTKVWDQARIEPATPSFAVRQASVVGHVTNCPKPRIFLFFVCGKVALLFLVFAIRHLFVRSVFPSKISFDHLIFNFKFKYYTFHTYKFYFSILLFIGMDCLPFLQIINIIMLLWLVMKNLLDNMLVCFLALRPKSTAMVMAGRSVHLTTLFPGQAWTSG